MKIEIEFRFDKMGMKTMHLMIAIYAFNTDETKRDEIGMQPITKKWTRNNNLENKAVIRKLF